MDQDDATPPCKAHTPDGLSSADLAKYVAEQFKAEIEHNRSWPTKIMAFYVAVCFGVVGAIITLSGRPVDKVNLLPGQKWLVAGFLLFLALYTILVLWRNHHNYIRYRNIQVAFQKTHLRSYKEVYCLPEEWFEEFKGTFWRGVGYYIVFVLLVVALSSCVICLS